MNKRYIPVNEPSFNGNEEKYLIECIRSGWVSSEGPFVSRFEEGFAARVQRRYGIAVSNGSVALDLAVVSIGIKDGDEVIMPAHTIISCAAAVIRAGGVPVLVDCDPYTYNMNVGDVEARITCATKAIMAVHIFGLPVDMDPIFSIAERHGLKVIEDAAQMHGQTYKGRPCGSLGDVSTFSFYSNKHITTGEGGMIVTDDPEIARRCRSFRNLCFKSEQRFLHDELGWNYRMTNLQAAVGVAQLENLDKIIEKKRLMGKKYIEFLSHISEIQLPISETDYADNNYWVFPIVLGDEVERSAIDVMAALHKDGIGSRPFFWPIHEQPVLRDMGLFSNESYAVSERIARRGFYIPSSVSITEKQMLAVSAAVQRALL